MRYTYKDPKVQGGYNSVNNDDFACVGKLGQYEDIDEDPENLAKAKQALDIIKKKHVSIYPISVLNVGWKTYNKWWVTRPAMKPLLKMEYELLRKELL